jgi:TolA-binding protein
MFHTVIKILSLCLLVSITFSFPLPQSQGQYRNHPGATEITFFGKEETKWIEKREVPLPVIIGQGIKEEPRLDSFDLSEDSIGRMQKMRASTTQPGCAYSSRFTSGLAKAFVGDKALYEQGRYRYLKGAYEDAIASFQKLIQEYPQSEWIGSSHYWMGEAKYHQEKDDEAFLYFRKVVEKYPESEFYAHALYSCGWIRLKQVTYEEGHQFFHQVYEKTPHHPIAESSLFWSGYCLYQLGRYSETLQEMDLLLQKYPSGKWRPEAEYLIGVSYFRLKKFKEAADQLKDFWKRFPKHPLEESSRYALAWSLVSSGQYFEGRKTFENILLTYPGTRLSDPIYLSEVSVTFSLVPMGRTNPI